MEWEAHAVLMCSHCLMWLLPRQRGTAGVQPCHVFPPLQRCWLDPGRFGHEDGLRGELLRLTQG